ncbi:sugar phosphate isomerase/epimerase family protein [Flavobacterium sp.]|uniref:sugar phosphate isomerase/epimerase family protein n=1 Tax=Flavobacterium sp. TaxID=239 RepID=UPI004034373F
MTLHYLCPHWGSEGRTAEAFFESVLKEGYDGIEINMPDDGVFIEEFKDQLSGVRETRPGFAFIAQCVPDARNETLEEHIERVMERLRSLADLKPDAINSHTGKDYYSFEENCKVIEAIEDFAEKNNVRILHETHRGRFSFHGPSLLPYLERFPQIELVADYSHWCNVSESMLEGQGYILEKILPHIGHIHARIGHPQGPQAADPFAPEWHRHLDCFLSWWKDIRHYKTGIGETRLTVTPEFGPAPYMPAMPFTGEPLGDQWNINAKMKEYLKINLN